MRMLLRDTVLCEDVAARYPATDGADGAGVRMLLRDTVLRTVGRCWCEDVATRYRAADGAGETMALRDTVLWTVLV